MKKNIVILVVLLLTPLVSLAQSVSVDSVSTVTMCDTAQVTVYYSAIGSFDTKNVFTAQLSAADGSFSPYFANAGAVRSTTSGSVVISISHGDHYRVRMSSSKPYMVSGDNGQDIKVSASPSATFYCSRDSAYSNYRREVTNALEGDTVYFASGMRSNPNLSFSWDFGSGASPQTGTSSIENVIYSSAGPKTVSLAVTNTDGCTRRDTEYAVNVFDCNTSVPADAIIDSETYTFALPDTLRSSIWVVPGGTLTLSDWYGTTVFAEPGSTIISGGGRGMVIYLKPGAVLNGYAGDNVVIYSPGASIASKGSSTLECPSLTFDYSLAPPYKITWQQAAVSLQHSPTSNVRVYPDPARNIVRAEATQTPRSIIIRNELGASVLTDKGPILTNNFEFDVTQFPAGNYFLEVATEQGPQVTKFTVSH